MNTDTKDLQVYLKLNELRQGQNSTKEVHDFSQNEYHGIALGLPTPTADDRFGSCLHLGKQDSIRIDKGSQNKGINLLAGKSDSFTLGFWFKPTVEEVKEGDTAIVLSVKAEMKAEQQSLTIVQKTLASSQESTPPNECSLQVEINGKDVIDATSPGRIKYGEWNHVAIAIDRKGEQPKIEVYLNELGMTLNVDNTMLGSLILKNCVIEIAPQLDQQKFTGQAAHLRIYNGLLALAELKKEIQDDETATSAFNKSHPIEFDLHNENDEHVLYISDKEEQSLILGITNTSAEDIEFQFLKSGESWQDWKADESCYHFQLSFRPGTLSDFSTKMLQSPKFRLRGLSQGWDCVYDPNDSNLVDWISFLWVGEDGNQLVKEIANKEASTQTQLKGLFDELKAQVEQLEDSSELLASLQELQKKSGALEDIRILGEKLGNGSYGLPKKGVGIVTLGGLSAAAGGGARGTRVHLKYDRLSYSAPAEKDATQVPNGTRSQFLNIINRQGKANIPLHVGFVGSNTVLNDGVTSNELTLRISNLQKEPLPLEGGNGSPQFRLYFDFEDQSAGKGEDLKQHELEIDGWEQEWAIASLTNAKNIEIKGRDLDDKAAWKISVQDLQVQPYWLLEPEYRDEKRTLYGKETVEFSINNLVSDAPDGFANLYVEYKNIPGYWDGRIICPIEKSPLVYRNQLVGIGTNAPEAKLHISVGKERSASGNQYPAAVFVGGNVGIGVADPKIHLAIGDNDTGFKQEGDGELAIFTDAEERVRVNHEGITVKNRIRDKTGEVMPVGSILPYAGANAPAGWLLCDGRQYSQKQYCELYDVIQDRYGSADSSDNFRVPNLCGRFPVGSGGGYNLGRQGGEERVALEVQHLPNHTHGVNDPGHSHTYDDWQGGNTQELDNDDFDRVGHPYVSGWDHSRATNHVYTGIQVNTTGGNQPHENCPPFLALNFIIKT